jgi:N-hydroxyarylamine O-acetyltransferase
VGPGSILSRVTAVLDLDAYLERIGLSGRPSVREVHVAHSTSIPFENLDPHRGQPVSLALEDLQRKLVHERRGGYCFEQNLLLKAALEALGAEVDMYLARVLYVSPPGVTRPRSHLVLGVRHHGEHWHADVGFGPRALLAPIPFGPGEEHEQSGWRYRVLAHGSELVLQSHARDGWMDLYRFPAEPVPAVDVETINWWACTHPKSPFVTGLIVSTQDERGTRTSVSDRDGLALTELTPRDATVTPLELDAVPGVLAERFGLSGFAVGADGRIRLAGR